jgi:hypothetical protein
VVFATRNIYVSNEGVFGSPGRRVTRASLEDMKMNMPGFNADASLYKTERYRAAASSREVGTAVYQHN